MQTTYQIILLFTILISITLFVCFIIRKNYWKFMASHDSLTGLLNREEFEKQLVKRMQYVTQNNKYMLVYIMIDLDDFKKINDTKGHKEGDRILKNVAKSLNKYVDELRYNCYFGNRKASYKDLVCRYGGEEFAIVIMTERKALNNLIEDKFDEACLKGGCSASIGSAMFLPYMDVHVKNLTNKADFIMYKHKRAKKKQTKIMDEEFKQLCPGYKQYKIQEDRRQYKRIKVDGIVCSFRFANNYNFREDTIFHGRLIDISEGGIKFLSQVTNAELMKKNIILEIEFTINSKKHLHHIEIRYFDSIKNVCGCKFV